MKLIEFKTKVGNYELEGELTNSGKALTNYHVLANLTMFVATKELSNETGMKKAK